MNANLNEQTIKNRIRELYESNPHIHISISMRRPRIELSNVEAVIKGVYSHLFSIEVRDKGYPQTYNVQYTEILINRVEIAEL